MELYVSPIVDRFLDRATELSRLEEWWAGRERMPLNVYGRRRVGKSWLLRRFAHGKPAVVLVAERLAPGSQLTRFAAALEPILGVEPALPNVATLFRVLLRVARDTPLLAVIDEFPWLLGTSEAEIETQLSAIQAVLEDERDHSQLKLVLCGSAVAQMESLGAERSPLHGRLVPLELRPLPFEQARAFLPTLPPERQLERFALTGGMPRYLDLLGGGDLRTVVCRQVLDRNGPLYNEARTILEQELRQPAVYFSLLEQLAGGDKEVGELSGALRAEGRIVSKYLLTLQDLRIVGRHAPIGAQPGSRSGHWRLEDPFFRFWFRFVFPFQAGLETGTTPGDLYDTEIRPDLADHVAPVFEEWTRGWTRRTHGPTASQVGAWWGPARHDLRRRKVRQTEEVDVVGLSRGRVTLVGEAKWTNRALDVGILADLHDYKVPALAQAGFRIVDRPGIVLFSRSGYTRGLQKAAAADDRIELVDVAAELAAP